MSLAEKLGFKKNAKLLIIHADDGGLMQPVNTATRRLLGNGSITSASYMMNTPCIRQASENYPPDHDMGVHVVLNSEWPDYRWGVVADPGEVPSLLDESGKLWSDHALFRTHATAEEAARELEAQILKAFNLGFRPSHLDTHMGSVYVMPEVLDAYVTLARKFRLIPMLPRWSKELEEYFSSLTWLDAPALKKRLLEFESRNEVLLDRIILDAGGASPQDRTANYLRIARSLAPGLTQLIVHLCDPDSAFDALIKRNPRERRRYWDVEILQGDEFKSALHDNAITLIDWRNIQRMRYPETL